MSANKSQIEKLLKAREVLASSHVSSVEVGFEYEMDNIRYYSVVTYKNGEAHRYQVRVQDWYENGEKQTVAGCNCKASAKDMVCRHILKVAQVDAQMCNRDMHLDTFQNYSAHRCYARKSAAV